MLGLSCLSLIVMVKLRSPFIVMVMIYFQYSQCMILIRWLIKYLMICTYQARKIYSYFLRMIYFSHCKNGKCSSLMNFNKHSLKKTVFDIITFKCYDKYMTKTGCSS
eukprot:NODE_277_length_11973_cov_0.221895.p12 type:complete len:107 gc:universal NODE_277_length_11973_cov_0.221895:4892-5212(+)